ncbi:protein phosphatase 1 regulatory subunit 15A [Carlito syrichta]|uniref:Protein phosphatase 1 regulatory subunit 15A n=1 Tax=Carlito syrichta TaxID=1868482 RepID=A0A3Q0DMV5_CARSF|nr:protein phosphatase 1 regulatory subunit 15A [Carlito syrichta]
MAPGQVPHHTSSRRDAHSLFLLSPLMGFLSRAWCRLRYPGPLEPWLVETGVGADQGEAGLEGEAKAPLATHHAPWGRHSQGEAEDRRAPEEDGEAAWETRPDLNTNSSPPEGWGCSDDSDDEYSEEEAVSIPGEQGSQVTDGQPALLSPSLLIKTLQGSDKDCGEEEATGEGVAEDEGVTKVSYPSSCLECCPVVEGKEDGEAVQKEALRNSASPLSPGSKPSTLEDCPEREEDHATEEENTDREASETSVSSSSSGSNPRAWECCSGEESKEKCKQAHKAAEREAGPEPHLSVPAHRPLLRAWEDQPDECTEQEDEEEDEEEEEEDNTLGATEKERGAEYPPPIPFASAFLKAWVYLPGEDTEEEEDEEEDEDSDSGSAEEEGEAEASASTPTTSAFLKVWVYRPGEDTEDEEEDEDSDSGSAEEEGEAGASASTAPTSTFLKTWVYRPGEDTEEDEEEDEDTDSGSGNENKGEDSEAAGRGEAAASGPHPSCQAQSAFLRAWVYQPGEETEEEEAAEEWAQAEPRPFRVAIYLPGEKPPPPWATPKLPLRLQRRLKSSETPTRDPDPETPLKPRKVCFSEKVTVHFLAVWAGPAQANRRGPWEQLARDRSRFARRIAQAQEVLGPCLTPAARARAWARLRNPPSASTPIPALAHTLPSSIVTSVTPVQAMPLSHAVATSPSPPPCAASSPCLDLGGKRD